MTGPRDKERGRAVGHVNIVLPEIPGAEGPTVVERIVRALYAHAETLAAIKAAGGGTDPRYVTLSDLGGSVPPRGVPFYNDAIGVLTVPAPAGGTQVVQSAIKDVAPLGTRVEESVVERSQGHGGTTE